MSSSSPKSILVTGATGNQGRAVLSQLLSLNAHSPSPLFTIFAVTRNTTSLSAKTLAENPHVTLVQGNLDHPSSIFSSLPKGVQIWGVYSVQIGIGQTEASEIAQGTSLIDASLAHGVRHFVYSSLVRHPPSVASKIRIAQFESKVVIEAHLKEACKDGAMNYTILQPSGFFENMKPGMQGAVFAGILKWNLPKEYKLAYISTDDIGWFAAQSFEDPENPAYKNKEIAPAGDTRGFDDIERIYREKTGKNLPLPPMGRLLPWLVSNVFVKELGELFRYFSQAEYEIDIEGLRKLHPGLKDFAAWLEGGRRGGKATWAR